MEVILTKEQEIYFMMVWQNMQNRKDNFCAVEIILQKLEEFRIEARGNGAITGT